MKNAQQPTAIARGALDRPITVTMRKTEEILGVGESTVASLVRDKKLKTLTIGRRRLIVYASIEDLVERLSAEASAA
jgi:excisionase family DNA binding protein